MIPLLTLLACSKTPASTEAAASPRTAAEPTPVESSEAPADLTDPASTDPFDQVVRALSIKDPAPECDRVEALVDDPTAMLLRVVHEVEKPPWVAMRAASCLVTRHSTEIEAEMVGWMAREDLKGLGLLTLNHLDEMEPRLAVTVAEAALAGPFADAARTRILRADHAEVKALVD